MRNYECIEVDSEYYFSDIDMIDKTIRQIADEFVRNVFKDMGDTNCYITVNDNGEAVVHSYIDDDIMDCVPSTKKTISEMVLTELEENGSERASYICDKIIEELTEIKKGINNEN